MIDLHCGWPKTGTTSLQSALVELQGRLAAEDVVYTERWRRPDGHHAFEDVVKADRSGSTDGELRRFLDANRARSILFSSETLATWAMEETQAEVFLRFVGVLGRAAPVRCFWTLRRIDEMVHSAYRQMTYIRRRLPSRGFIDQIDPSRFFANMLRIGDAVEGGAVYVRYAASGAHNAELLRGFDIPPQIAAEIESHIADAPRRNDSVGQKMLAAVLDAERLSARSGTALDPPALKRMFRAGFRFEDDRPCVLADRATRQALHERALEAARSCGFAEYLRFFEDEVVEDDSSPVRLDADVLTDADLERLVAHALRSDPP